MNERIYVNTHSLALVRSHPTTPATYSLAEAARFGGIHTELLRYYCQIGLFTKTPVRLGEPLIFDDAALYELRRFEHYRRHHGVSRRTLRVLSGLWREISHLYSELRFLRRT